MTPAAAVQPDFGFQKIRVGVQIKTGAWVPPGTTTAGTRLRIIETGPGVDGKKVTLCLTEAGTAASGDDPTATFCVFPKDIPTDTQGKAVPAVVVSPGPSDLDSDAYYIVQPRDKVRVFQTTVNSGLLRDTDTGKVAPCTVPPDAEPVCDGDTDVVFVDPGLPPLAVDDTASTVSPQSVSIDVLANDQGQGAPENVDSATDPAHGSVQLVSGSPDKVTYTPDAGFTGVDTFDYTMSTANGTSTATVTVTVTAPPTTSSSTPPPTSETPPPAAPNGLSNTGVPASALEDLAAALLLAGGAATVVGRRRYRGRHV